MPWNANLVHTGIFLPHNSPSQILGIQEKPNNKIQELKI